jgi:hypothetical protein
MIRLAARSRCDENTMRQISNLALDLPPEKQQIPIDLAPRRELRRLRLIIHGFDRHAPGYRAASARHVADSSQQRGLQAEFMDPIQSHREERASQFQ